MSVILFDDRIHIKSTGRLFHQVPELQSRIPGGTTSYKAAMEAARNVLLMPEYENFQPVIVFMTDGQPDSGDSLEDCLAALTDICNHYNKVGMTALKMRFIELYFNPEENTEKLLTIYAWAVRNGASKKDEDYHKFDKDTANKALSETFAKITEVNAQGGIAEAVASRIAEAVSLKLSRDYL